MNFQLSRKQGVANIALAGRIEAGDVERLKEPFRKVEEAGLKKVEVDFSALIYIGSAGIATLLAQQKALAARGGDLSIINAPANIASLFQSLKLDRVFKMAPRG